MSSSVDEDSRDTTNNIKMETSSLSQGDAGTENIPVPDPVSENSVMDMDVDENNIAKSNCDGTKMEIDSQSEKIEKSNVKSDNDEKDKNISHSQEMEISDGGTNPDSSISAVSVPGVSKIDNISSRLVTIDDGGESDQNKNESKEMQSLELEGSNLDSKTDSSLTCPPSKPNTDTLSLNQVEATDTTLETTSISLSGSGNNGEHQDRQRSLLLLSHRKMILFRLRQCKKAAEERLMEYQRMDDENQLLEKNESNDTAKNDVNNQLKPISTLPPKLPLKSNHEQNFSIDQQQKVYERKIYNNREEEMNAYKELQSFATSFTNRRQSSSSIVGGAGGGTSISLRTGSSVGNKMKAAVATLTSNSLRATSLSPFSVGNLSDKEEQHNQGGKRVAGNSNTNMIQNTADNQPSNATASVRAVSNEHTIERAPSVTISNNYMPVHGGDGELKQQVSLAASSLTKQNSSMGKQLKKKVKRSRSSSSKKLPSANNHAQSSSLTLNNESSTSNISVNMPLHHGIINNAANIKNGIGSWNGASNQPLKGPIPNHLHASGMSSKYLHPPSSNTYEPHGANSSRNMFRNILLPQKVPPRILCPETDRLRRKRKQIESKLQGIFKKRYLSSLNQGFGDCNSLLKEWDNGRKSSSTSLSGGPPLSSPTSTTFDFSSQHSTFQRPISSAVPNENPYCRHVTSDKDQQTPLQWKTYMSLGGHTPSLLPPRKKTQWDFVLEEMRWLATDFIEERKWKKACARTMSYSVSSYAPKFASSPSSSRRSTTSIRNTSSSSIQSNKLMSSSSEVNAVDSSNVKLIKIEREKSSRITTKQTDVCDEKEDNSDEECANEEECSDHEQRSFSEIHFEDPTESDIQENRSISKILGRTVVDNWNIISADSELSADKTDVFTIFSRFHKMKCDMKQGIAVDCDINLSTKTKNSALGEDIDFDEERGDKKQQSSIEDIVVAMEDSLAFIDKLRIDLPSKYESYEKKLSKDLKEIQLELHVSQIKCLQYAEALWDESSKSNLGATGFVVNGPVASGKTFSICALLWRRRNIGPQLLVCSLSSLVSHVAFFLVFCYECFTNQVELFILRCRFDGDMNLRNLMV